MKKYKLKPGRHQFAPRSAAVHTNDNLSDEEAKWYLQTYPHIANLFEKVPSAERQPVEPEKKSVKSQKIDEILDNSESVKSTKIGEIPTDNEDLFTTN